MNRPQDIEKRARQALTAWRYKRHAENASTALASSSRNLYREKARDKKHVSSGKPFKTTIYIQA